MIVRSDSEQDKLKFKSEGNDREDIMEEIHFSYPKKRSNPKIKIND